MPIKNTSQFDLVVQNVLVATVSDQFCCDIGIKDGRIIALAESLETDGSKIDAAGKLITPGGVDSHCHMDQPMPDGLKMADDFASSTLSAACGGTTTVIPFAAQE
jgi:dihydropyrimidinase